MKNSAGQENDLTDNETPFSRRAIGFAGKRCYQPHDRRITVSGRKAASVQQGTIVLKFHQNSRCEMQAQTSSPASADIGLSARRAARQGLRLHPTMHRRRASESRISVPQPDLPAEGATSILVASVGAVQRTLRHSAAPDAVEMACAETYRQPADRERYLAARMLLRHALSKAVGGSVAATDWRYQEGPFGKPMMAAGLPPLEFSVSHSGSCVAVGVNLKAPIGVDLECIDPAQGPGVIYDVLTEPERDRIQKYPADQQEAEFIRVWTVKEACSKALGLGLSLYFERMEVQFDSLRVRLLDRPVSATSFEVATTTLARNGRRYSLSTARIVDRI